MVHSVAGQGPKHSVRVAHDNSTIPMLEHRQVVAGITGDNDIAATDARRIREPLHSRSLVDTGGQHIEVSFRAIDHIGSYSPL